MSQVQATLSFTLLDSAKQHLKDEDKDVDTAREILSDTIAHFPELAGHTITVGITHEDMSWHQEPHAAADPYNDMIYINAGCLQEYQVWFHELMHLVIYNEHWNGKDVPHTSEKYCSIRAIAKMPKDMVYRNDIAYLGESNAPKDDWPEICQRALDYREDHRNYIQQCKAWLGIND